MVSPPTTPTRSPLLPPPFPPSVHAKKTKPDDEGNTSSRPLGLVVARGTLLVLLNPMDGSEEIANPFLGGGEE